jgi:hypothetical protein
LPVLLLYQAFTTKAATFAGSEAREIISRARLSP